MNAEDSANPRPAGTGGPNIVNHGTVHTASQGGDGYVAAMGDNARGYLFVNGRSGADAELRELVSQLRRLYDDHAGELDSPEQVDDAITDLEEKVDDNAAPERLRRTTGIILLLTRPVQAFVELLTRIQDLIDKIRA